MAARLATTTASVCLVEAETDVCDGASKGNAGVAVSYYGPPGTLETELINQSCSRWEELCARLDVPYRRIGGVMVALTIGADLEHAFHTASVVEGACEVYLTARLFGEVRELPARQVEWIASYWKAQFPGAPDPLPGPEAQLIS